MAWDLLTLVLWAVVTTRAEGFQCPEVRVQTLIADPEDCRRYHHCLPDGRVFSMQCPTGLVFDDRRNVCIWDSIAQSCAPGHGSQPISSRKSADSATTTHTEADKPKKGSNSDHRSHKTPLQQHGNRKQVHQHRNRKPVPHRESKIDWGHGAKVNSMATEMTVKARNGHSMSSTVSAKSTSMAPEVHGRRKRVRSRSNSLSGMDRSGAKEMERVIRKGKTNGDSAPRPRRVGVSHRRPSRIYGSSRRQHRVYRRSPEDNLVGGVVFCPTAYAYIPDPESCSSFHQCYHWQPIKKACPPGLHFDVGRHICNWQHHVDCQDGDRGDTFNFNKMITVYRKTLTGRTSTKKKARTSSPRERSPADESETESPAVSSTTTSASRKPSDEEPKTESSASTVSTTLASRRSSDEKTKTESQSAAETSTLTSRRSSVEGLESEASVVAATLASDGSPDGETGTESPAAAAASTTVSTKTSRPTTVMSNTGTTNTASAGTSTTSSSSPRPSTSTSTSSSTRPSTSTSTSSSTRPSTSSSTSTSTSSSTVAPRQQVKDKFVLFEYSDPSAESKPVADADEEMVVPESSSYIQDPISFKLNPDQVKSAPKQTTSKENVDGESSQSTNVSTTQTTPPSNVSSSQEWRTDNKTITTISPPRTENVHEPSDRTVKTRSNKQKNSITDTPVSTTTRSSTEVPDKGDKTSIQHSTASSLLPTQTSSGFQTTAGEIVTETSSPKAVKGDKTEHTNTTSGSVKVHEPATASSSAPSPSSFSTDTTKTATDSATSASSPDTTGVSIEAFKNAVLPASPSPTARKTPTARITTSGEKNGTTLTTLTTTRSVPSTTKGAPSVVNSTSQPVVNSTSQPLTSDGPDTDMQGRSTYNLSRPSPLPANTSDDQFHKLSVLQHSESPEDVQIEKYMNNPLDHSATTKPVESVSSKSDRKEKEGESSDDKKRSHILNVIANQTRGRGDEQNEKKLLPLVQDARAGKDVTETKNAQYTTVSGKVVSEVSVSTTTSSGVTNKQVSNVQDTVVNDPTDRSVLSKLSPQSSGLPQVSPAVNDSEADSVAESVVDSELEYSGEAEDDQHTDTILILSSAPALERVRQDPAKPSSSPSSIPDKVLAKEQSELRKEFLQPYFVHVPLTVELKKEEERAEIVKTAESVTINTITFQNATRQGLVDDNAETRSQNVSDVPETRSKNVSEAPETRSQNVSDVPETRSQNVSEAPETISQNVSDVPETRSQNVSEASETISQNVSEAPETLSKNVSDAPETSTTVLRSTNTTLTHQETTKSTAVVTAKLNESSAQTSTSSSATTATTVPQTTSKTDSIQPSDAEEQLLSAFMAPVIRVKQQGENQTERHYYRNPQPDSDAIESSTLKTEIDGNPLEDKSNISQKTQEKAITTTESSFVKEESIKTGNTSSMEGNLTGSQSSPENNTVISLPDDTVMEKNVNESSSKPDSLPSKNCSVNALASSRSVDDDDVQLPGNEDIVQEPEHNTDTTNLTSGPDNDVNDEAHDSEDHASTTLDISSIGSSTEAVPPSKNQNLTSPVPVNSTSDSSAEAITDRSTRDPELREEMESLSAASSKEREETVMQEMESTLLVSVELEDKQNLTPLLVDNSSTISKIFSTTVGHGNESSPSPVTTTTVPTMEPDRSTNATVLNDNTINSTLLPPSTEKSAVTVESTQIPETYLRNNTGFVTENLTNNDTEDISQNDDSQNVEKSESSEVFVAGDDQSTTTAQLTSNTTSPYTTTVPSHFNSTGNTTSQSTTNPPSHLNNTENQTLANFSNEPNTTGTSENGTSGSPGLPAWSVGETTATTSVASQNTTLTATDTTATTSLKQEVPDDENRTLGQQMEVITADSVTTSGRQDENSTTTVQSSSSVKTTMKTWTKPVTANQTTASQDAGLDGHSDSPVKPSEQTTTANTSSTETTGTTEGDGSSDSKSSFVSLKDVVVWFLNHWKDYMAGSRESHHR